MVSQGLTMLNKIPSFHVSDSYLKDIDLHLKLKEHLTKGLDIQHA